MYHEDRLGGGGFSRVVLAGASSRGPEMADRIRRDLEGRVGRHVEALDFRGAVALRDRICRRSRTARQPRAGGRRDPSRAGGVVLRTNLATRPFYNERAAHAAIALAALIVLAITALNVVQVVTLSQHNTELSSQIDAERAEVDTADRRSRADSRHDQQGRARAVVGAAQEANALIDQRTFSWTAFFNQIEATLPPDVMLTSVRPSFKNGRTHVDMGSSPDVPKTSTSSWTSSKATGAFEDIVPATQDRTEEGLFRAADRERLHTPRADAESQARRPRGYRRSQPGARSRAIGGAMSAARVFQEKRGADLAGRRRPLVNVALYAIVVYPLSKKVAGGEQAAEASAAALAAARRDYAAARATVAGKGQADVELEKFYSEVLPPDVSGARRITFLRIEQLATQAGSAARARDLESTAAARQQPGQVHLRCRALGGVSEHPPLHPRSRNRAGISRARERPVDSK